MDYVTKQDFLSAFEKIISPIRGELVSSCGRPNFGSTATVYPQDAIYSESYLRQFWGLVPYWYGGHGDEEFRAAMRRGLVAGTDPASPHYWGVCGDFDQRFVEMAPLAYALLFVPDVVWTPLTDDERKNLYDWVWQINEHNMPANNWRFFRVLVNIAFKHLGLAYSTERLDEDRAAIESYYTDGGWYRDGAHGQRDYYIAWAFHFYGLIYACFEEDAYAEAYRARAKAFAEDFIYWFADGGAAVPYGRSLTYRLAQGSFWGMCLLAGVEVYDLGVVKGILSRHLSDWLSAPIFDNGGALTIGYRYSNLIMGEHYNAPGSPYWALKFFAPLGLADDHPFWAAEIKPMPPLKDKKLLPHAEMIATRYRGDAFLYPKGTIMQAAFGQMGAKYLKFVYSTRFGLSMKFGDYFLIEACADSTLTFDVGGVFCDRRIYRDATISEDGLTVIWSPIEGITVTTEITPDAASHTRRHVIDSAFDCTAYDCGFAVASRESDDCRDTSTSAYAEARNRHSACRVSAVGAEGEPLVIAASPNANIVFRKAVIPAVKYTIPRGRSEFVTKVEIE